MSDGGGFWNTFGPSVLGGAGAGFAASIGGGLFGQTDGARRRAERRARNSTIDLVNLGNNLDLRNQREMFDYRLAAGEERGLTAVELFGSPASSPGGGTTGSGATLGNAASQQAMQSQQLEQQNRLSLQQLGIQTGAQLQQTKMQTDAQKEVARIQSGVTERGQDINQEIAQQTLALKREELQNTVRQTTALIGKTEAETRKVVNEVATSDPKFVTAMKQLSMGPANLLVELTLRHHGIALSDESFTNLPETKRQEILDQLLALSSTAYVEGQGGKALGGGAVEGAKDIVQSIWTILQTAGKNVKQIANQFTPAQSQSPPALGNGPRFSEPGAAGPNMNYR